MQVAERKKRAGGQENKLVEIEKPRGFDRQLPVERILGVTDCNAQLMFLIKWVDCDELDLLPASVVNQEDPDTVIAFYEQRSNINQKFEQRNLVRKEIEQKLIDNPATVAELPVAAEPAVEEAEPMETNAAEVAAGEDNVDERTVTSTDDEPTQASSDQAIAEVADDSNGTTSEKQDVEPDDSAVAVPEDIEIPNEEF